MTRARLHQNCCQDTHYYQCSNRVVRRAFLYGFDQTTQQDFVHRRCWMLDGLAGRDVVFCIDICSYSIMSNHYHLVIVVHNEIGYAITFTMILKGDKLTLPNSYSFSILNGLTWEWVTFLQFKHLK